MISHAVIVKVAIFPPLTWYQEAKEARKDKWSLSKSENFDINYTIPLASAINN